jgi:hypothetical protein
MLAAPGPRQAEPVVTGTYHVIVSSPRAGDTPGFLVLEQAGEQMTGTLMLSDAVPAALSSIVVRDALVTAELRTSDGRAIMQLRVVGSDLTGEIVRDRVRFPVVGHRTGAGT